MNSTDSNCAHCGHPKSDHYHGLGLCTHWGDGRMCTCCQFLRLRWDKWQNAKLGTQPAVVRFRRHNNPTTWRVNVKKTVEVQVKDTMQIHNCVVTQVNPDGYCFISLS